MPHISIKHWPRDFTPQEKTDLVDSLTALITRVFRVEEGSVSIAVEPVPVGRWREWVHVPELEERSHLLWKQPNYSKPIPSEGSK